jgi:hypothetical protein
MNKFNIKKRENNLSLNQNKTYKSQYELLLNKFNSTKSNEKLMKSKIKLIKLELIILILLKKFVI